MKIKSHLVLENVSLPETILFPSLASALAKLESSFSVLHVQEARLGHFLLDQTLAIKDQIRTYGRVQQFANLPLRRGSPLAKMFR